MLITQSVMASTFCPHADATSSLRCGRRAGRPAARLCRLLVPRERLKKDVFKDHRQSCLAPLPGIERGSHTEQSSSPIVWRVVRRAAAGRLRSARENKTKAMFQIQLLDNHPTSIDRK